MQYSRKMGIDFGQVRIGIALSDPLCIIASPYETYKRTTLEKDIEHILNLVKTQNVDTVVFGLPYQPDGTEGKTAAMVREFANELKKLSNVNIVFEDERLSSVEAEEILLSANVRREDRKMLIDKIAAQIILQQYIERR